jgi:hypothetical protein
MADTNATPTTTQSLEADFLNLLTVADQVATIVGSLTPGSTGIAISAGATVAQPILSSLANSLATNASPAATAQGVLNAAVPAVLAKYKLPANVQTVIASVFSFLTAGRWSTVAPPAPVAKPAA